MITPPPMPPPSPSSPPPSPPSALICRCHVKSDAVIRRRSNVVGAVTMICRVDVVTATSCCRVSNDTVIRIALNLADQIRQSSFSTGVPSSQELASRNRPYCLFVCCCLRSGGTLTTVGGKTGCVRRSKAHCYPPLVVVNHQWSCLLYTSPSPRDS